MRLNILYFSLSFAERRALAERTDLAPGYLWQIATRWRGKRPSIETIRTLVAADERLTLSDLMDEFGDPLKAERSKTSVREAIHA